MLCTEPMDDLASLTALFIDTVSANGCTITEAEAEALLAPQGLDMDTTREIVGALIDRGDASFEGGVLRLSDAICTGNVADPGIEGAAYADALAAAIAAEGCAVTEANSADIIRAADLAQEEAEAALVALLDAQLATADGARVTLDAEYCAALGGGETVKPGGSPEELLADALRANGCRMSETDAEAMLPGMGLSMDEAIDIARRWVAEGEASFEGDDLVLGPALCNAGSEIEVPDRTEGGPADVLKAAMFANGCRLSEDRAMDILPGWGLDMDGAIDIAMGWVDAGEASFEGDDLVLGDAACQPSPAVIEILEAKVLDVVRGAGCTIDEDGFVAAVGPIGFDPEVAGEVAEMWIESGLASVDEATDTLTLGDELCAGNRAEVEIDAGPTAEELTAILIEQIRLNGCQMTSDEAEEILPPFGFTEENTPPLIEPLLAAGSIEFDGSTVVLGDELCAGNRANVPAVSDADIRASIITAIPTIGGTCAMTPEDEAEWGLLVTATGVSEDEVDRVIGAMIDDGAMSYNRDTRQLVLAPEHCTVAEAVEEPVEVEQTMEQKLIAVIEANGCTMDGELAKTALPEAGIPLDQVRDLAGSLVAEGLAAIEGDVITLSTPACQ